MTIVSLLFLCLVALYVVSTRVALKFLPDYHDQILQLIHTHSNQQVKVDSIRAYWDKFNPVVQIKGFKYDEHAQHQNASISIDHISLNFSFIQSLMAFQPRFDDVLITDSQINIEQRADGTWSLQNGSQADSELQQSENNDDLLKYVGILNGSIINIKNLNTVIFNERGRLRALRLPFLNVNYEDDGLHASGQILQKSNDSELLSFSLQGKGNVNSEQFKSVLYIEATSSEFFGELLGVYDWNKISIQNIEGSARAWLNFKNFELTSIFGDVLINKIDWQVAETTQHPIESLAFSYLYEFKKGYQELRIDDFSFSWSDHQCSPFHAKLTLTEELLRFKSNKVDLFCISQLSQSLNILPAKLQDRLSVSQPKGYLKNLAFMLPLKNVEETPSTIQPKDVTELTPLISTQEIVNQLNISLIPETYRLEAELDSVSLNAFFSTPSAKNLSGYLLAQDNLGYVSFLSEEFELGFPSLFIEPWSIKRAEGIVSWQISNDEVLVASDGLRLRRSDDSLIYGDFKLLLNNELEEDYLNLAIAMQDLKINDATKFVPYHAVSHDLYNWLDQSLKGGVVSSGIYYGHGSVEHNAPKKSFTSSILLNTENGTVKFDSEWPALEQLSSSIIIQNSKLDIDAQHAKIAGSKLNALTARLPESQPDSGSVLTLSANSALSSKQIAYWLSESPIAEKTRDISAQFDINSGVSVQLALAIPMSQPTPSKKQLQTAFKVETTFKDADIRHKTSDLHFKGFNGLLTVDSEKGVYSNSMTALLFEEPVNITVITDSVKKAGTKLNQNAVNLSTTSQMTVINLKGGVSLNKLMSHYKLAGTHSLLGKFNYRASLSLPSDEDKYPALSFRSDLVGVTCNCPPPFAKQSKDISNLWLSLLIKPNQYYLEGSILSDKHPAIKTELFFSDDAFSFGEVLINGATIKNTNVKGLNIAANFKRANLEKWIDFISGVLPKKEVTQEAKFNDLKQIQLYVDDLDAYGYLLQKNYAVIKPDKDYWNIQLDGKDIKGSVSLASENMPISLKLDLLNLVSIEKLLVKSPTKTDHPKEKIDPRGLPEILFSVKNLSIENRSSGSWSFHLSPIKTGAMIRDINGHVKGNNINGQINWRYDDQNKYSINESSIATFSMNGGDITYLFEAFDMPVMMSSKKMTSELSLHWPAAPGDFALDKLSGKVNLSMSDGFLKTEDQKTGILRLFGVLNAESIKRRLKLDFSDLYKSGVGFDTFEAQASIDQGLLTLTAPLLIDGPAGKYVMNGRSDLSTKALDIDMLVELPFSQNVPLAALVLGAPQIGGLVWVADKLLGEPLSALTTSRYDITGTWDEPVVNLQQALNASKKDRSQEKGKRNVGK